MHTCPGCNQPTIPFAEKWLATVEWPAECARCGELSYVESSASGVALIVGALLMTAAGFASVYFQVPWFFFGGGTLAAVFYLWHWKRIALTPTRMKRTASARRTSTAVGVAVLLSWLVR